MRREDDADQLGAEPRLEALERHGRRVVLGQAGEQAPQRRLVVLLAGRSHLAQQPFHVCFDGGRAGVGDLLR